MTVEERVARGAALLDIQKPGWENEIDLTSFNITSHNDCALAQLYGSFFDGERKLFPAGPCFKVGTLATPERQDWPAYTHGFMPPLDARTDEETRNMSFHDYDLGDAQAQALTTEWKRVITERRVLVR